MPEIFLDGKVELHAGNCLDVLAGLPENSIDACVCDPPYFLPSIGARFGKEDSADALGRVYNGGALAGFKGKPSIVSDVAHRVETWAAIFRVLKPGAHLASFSAASNFDEMLGAIKGAGFETRDNILHMIDESEAAVDLLNSLNDAQRAAFLKLVIEHSKVGGLFAWVYGTGFPKGKPLAKFMDKHYLGGALDDDELKRGPVTHSAAFYETRDVVLKPAFEPIVLARKPMRDENGRALTFAENLATWGTGSLNVDGCRAPESGNYPANVILDGSPASRDAFPVDAGGKSAARFFFSGKADADDRAGSTHPTIKKIDLMRWLVRLVTAPGQTVLDPFAGSGTTGEAAFREGVRAILVEIDAEFQGHIARRMQLCLAGPDERRRESIKAKIGDVPFAADSLFGSLNA